MAIDQSELVKRVKDEWFPAWKRERDRLDRIDRWSRWEHDKPHKPRSSTSEYKELSDRAQTPWLSLVVTTLAQTLYVEGYRRARDAENAPAWRWWQANGMDARQAAIHRAAITYGLSYETVLPGTTDQGEAIPVMRGVSPRRMIAFYENPADDWWPVVALRVDPVKGGHKLKVYDDTNVYALTADSGGSTVTFVRDMGAHNAAVCPVVRFTNLLDLEGRAVGEVEPYIPVAGRIDQTAFDRLVVQRFASWVVRTIAGMAKPDDKSEAEAEKLRLRVEDILVAEDSDTKFGSLPASELAGFISAKDSDVRDLAAVSQTPPHYLLGQIANLSAEALAAAEAALGRKGEERRHSLGESHEQSLRLGAAIMRDTAGARDVEAQVQWRDTESRSLAQAADALGKLAQMLGVPAELLWEKIPGWTQQDVERAKELAKSQGGINALVAQLTANTAPAPRPQPAPALNGS